MLKRGLFTMAQKEAAGRVKRQGGIIKNSLIIFLVLVWCMTSVS